MLLEHQLPKTCIISTLVLKLQQQFYETILLTLPYNDRNHMHLFVIQQPVHVPVLHSGIILKFLPRVNINLI